MKKEWEIFKEFIGSAGIDPDKYMALRRKTALESLANRYRNFAIASLFVVVYFGIMKFFMCDDIYTDILPLTVYASIVCLMGSVTDFILYRKINNIDIYSMPVFEVIERAYKCRKIHILYVIIVLPISIGFVTWFCFKMSVDRYMLNAMVFGALFGLAIGLRFLFKFMSDYKAVIYGD